MDKDGVIASGKLNEVIIVETIRPDGSRRVQQDFSLCPTMAEQHTAHLTDINYLIKKYKPDELASYLAARAEHRREIEGHDFSTEPNLQEGRNIIYQSKEAFKALPDEVKNHFSSHLEFLKFIDNPQNVEKMVKLGIATLRQIEQVKIPDNNNPPTPQPLQPQQPELPEQKPNPKTKTK